jgi:ribosomal protein S13
MYVRRKNVKGFSYAYLVESRWDKEKKQSYQVVIKYLGRLENLKLDNLTSEELAAVSKYMNTKLKVNGNMDSHIRKYQQVMNKYHNKIIKQKLVEQRKIEKVQEKVLSDLKMDKQQFSDRFGWKNTISNSIKMDITA